MLAKLTLSAELIDSIIFSMEDQDHLAVLNLETQKIINVTLDEEATQKVIPLPEWTSQDGFKTMREFCETLNDPLLQSELKIILDSGQGVFKRFKALLKNHSLVYRRWLAFKRRAMERRIEEWATQWDSSLELDKDVLESTFFSNEGYPQQALQGEDFLFLKQENPSVQLLNDFYQKMTAQVSSDLFNKNLPPEGLCLFGLATQPQWTKGDLLWSVSGPDGETVGLIWARPFYASKIARVLILSWYIDKDFRGLGLGHTVLERMKETLKKQGIEQAILPDPIKGWTSL